MAKIKEEDLRLNIIINSAGKTQLSDLEKQTKMNTMSLDELRKHLKLTNIALGKAVPGTQNWKNLQAEVTRTKQRLTELQGGAAKTGSALKSMTGKFIGIGTAVALLSKGVKNAVSNIADFEQANVNLSTILGVNVKQMGLLTDDALELGRRTQYTASQVTGLQTELAKLGFTQAQIHNMAGPTLNFATAVGTDLSSAASLAGATLRIFGIDAKDTEDALGVLAVSTNKSALDFSYLQTAMSTVGPVAKSFGLSLRDTTALLGTLANAGFDASSAATATRNILLNLADSSGKLATALGGPARTFPELMDGLKTLTERGIDLNEALAVTDKRSVAAFSSFLTGAENATELRDALEDVNGELDRIAEERMNTVQGATKSLQSAWEGFTLAFSNSKGPIKNFLQWMADTINRITDMLGARTRNTKGNAAEYVDYLFSQEEDESVVRKRIDDYVAQERENVRELSDKLAVAVGKEKRRLRKELNEAQDGLDFADIVQQSFMERQGVSTTGSASGSSPSTTSGGSSGAGIDTSKNKNKWSLNQDESFLKAKAALTKQYNDGDFLSKEAYEQQLFELEVASLTARLALHKEKGADREKLENDIQDKILKHNEDTKKRREEQEKEIAKLLDSLEDDKTKIAINAENRRYQDELKAFEKNKSAIEDQDAVLERMELQHQNNLRKIDLDAFDRRFELLKKQHDAEVLKVQNAYSEKKLAEINGSAKEKLIDEKAKIAVANLEISYLEKYLKELEALNTDDLKDEDAAGVRLKIQQVKQELDAVREIINGDKEGPFSGTGQGSLFGVSEEQWETLMGHLKDGKLHASDLVSAIAGIGGAAQEGLKIASQAIQLTNAKEQQEFKNYQKNNDKKRKELQDRLNAGLISQAQYDKSIANLQEEEDAKEEEMQARQAKRQKKASIAQAIIQSALAVVKTFAEWGYPLGIAPAAIMTGLGAAQVALIAATPTGYARGGKVKRAQDGREFNARMSPDKRGFISSPTILVGEEGGEYIIPADGLKNPTLAPFIGSIEAARRAGTLRSINFGAVSPMMYSAIPAMAAGGPTAQVQIPSADYSAILEGMKELGGKLENIRAIVPMLGKGGIVEALDNYDKIRKRGKL